MCGITGYISLNKPLSHKKELLSNAVKTLSKRGPDNIGIFRDENCELGHARLSIIDTSSDANQPMEDDSKQFVIVFNGELYNFKELKKELQNKGHEFKTNSDTEVILHSYMQYKEKCVDYFNGFFAFCIYDKLTNSCFIARDRFGIKPLYYSKTNDGLYFGSELKAILHYPIEKNIDKKALNLYFRHNYIPAPYTILSSCKKLLPGECITIKNKEITFYKYYSVKESKPCADDYDKAQKKIKQLLYDSVEKRMIADVPLGTFLSGGVDSSIISLVASRISKDINTFSIGFPDEPLFDESKYANLVAKHICSKHHTFEVTNKDLFNNLEEILDYIDEPFADSSAINVYLLSKKTKENVTVSLSGDGADELFTGYNKHDALFFADQKNYKTTLLKTFGATSTLFPSSRNSKIGNLGRKLKKLNSGLQLNKEDRYLQWAAFMDKNQIKELTNNNEIPNPLYNIDFTDFSDYLKADFQLVLTNDMLKKVDLMSMGNSLEVRTPFLDHNLVEYVFSLPTNYKIDSKNKKKILKDTFKAELPENLFDRKKHGFEVPLEKWFQNELKTYLKEKIFNNNPLVKQGYLNQDELSKMEQKLFSGNSGETVLHTWALIVLENWFRKYMM